MSSLTSSFSSFSFSQSSTSSPLSTSTSQAAPPSSSLLFSTGSSPLPDQSTLSYTSNTARLLAQQTPSSPSPLNPSPRTILPSLPSGNSISSLNSSTSGTGTWASSHAPSNSGRSPARPSLFSSPSARNLSSPFRSGVALPRSASLSSPQSSPVGRTISTRQSLNNREDVPSLDFSPGPLGSAALYSPEDDAVDMSVTIQSAAERQKNRLGSGVSWMGSPFSETSEIVITPPGTPSGGARTLNQAPDQLVLSANSIKRNFSNDAIMLALANRVAELDSLLASVSNEVATLRNENRHLKMTTFSAPEPSSSSASDRPSHSASSTPVPTSLATEEGRFSPQLGSSMSFTNSKIIPAIQPYSSGSLPLPPSSIVKSYICPYPSTDFRALLSASNPIPTFQARAEWCCAILAGAHVEQHDADSQVPVKDGPLRKIRDALSDILHLERRNSPRVCLLLDIVATAAVSLATRSQGNYLIQSSLSLGPDVRTALWSRIRPRFVEIGNASGGYGTHVLVQMIKMEDLKEEFMEELLKVTDGAFLGGRAGMRIVEQVFKSTTPTEASELCFHVSGILSGKWLSYATSPYGCILVQSLLEIYEQYKSFCDAFLLEINPYLPTLIASPHGFFVFQKLTHPHSPLRLSTLLALLLTPESDPLVAGPTFAKEALVAASADPSLDMDEVWESWEARVCEGELPPIVSVCHKTGAWNLFSYIFSSAPASLANRIRRVLLASSAYIRSHPPGSEIISAILSSSPLSHSSMALPLPAKQTLHIPLVEQSPQRQHSHLHLPPFGVSRSNSYSFGGGESWTGAEREEPHQGVGSISRSASFSGAAGSNINRDGEAVAVLGMGSVGRAAGDATASRSWVQAASGNYGSIGRGSMAAGGGGGPWSAGGSQIGRVWSGHTFHGLQQ